MNIKIDYDGEYPCLCSGHLVVTIDDKVWDFGSHSLCSGGLVSFDENWSENVTEGPWSISEWPKGFPNELQKIVLDEVNSEIPWGCCGGCI